jgi:hypothetical protein
MRWVPALLVGHPAFVIHVEGFDWKCPQHIPPRYTVEELMGGGVDGEAGAGAEADGGFGGGECSARGLVAGAARPLRPGKFHARNLFRPLKLRRAASV